MTDLDQLLRSDAERWNTDRPAIDLDQAAATATATAGVASADPSAKSASGQYPVPAGAGRARRRRGVWVLGPLLSAAAVVIVAAGRVRWSV